MLKNYADINHREERTGFNCLMMACHLTTEDDALRVIKLLCKHRFYDGQERCVDVDAKDFACNTPLHHAASTNKLIVCQYLINQEKVDVSSKNSEG